MENMVNSENIRLVAEIVNDEQPDANFILAMVNDFENSEKFKKMVKGKKYYKNENDVLLRERYFFDNKGNKKKLLNVTNDKIPHPFLKHLTRQKVAYALSKPLTVTSQNEELQQIVQDFMDEKFMKTLRAIATDAIVCSIGWSKMYYDVNGNLKMRRISPLNIRPFWGDTEHTELNAIIYFYKDDVFTNGKKSERKFVEFYNKHGEWKYMYDGNTIVPIKGYESGKGNFTIEAEVEVDGEKQLEQKEVVWNTIPFIAWKYNEEEQGLLEMIKPMVDSYDTVVSDCSNQVQDVPNKMKIIKGYEGANKDEFINNMFQLRTMFVDEDGAADVLDDSLDATFPEKHLDRLYDDIFEFGFGANIQAENLGSASGEALKLRYTNLDLDCQFMTNEFINACRVVIEFIKADQALKFGKTFTDEQVDITFNMDQITNESNVIVDAKNSVGVISMKTILKNHPWVADIEEEMSNLREEANEEEQNLFDFDNQRKVTSEDDNIEDE